MIINEIFYSIQGEGLLSGVPTVFIRTTGCNLRCKYCDTTYAYERGTSMNLNDIMSTVNEYSCNEVCITGGEPLLQKEIYNLLSILQNDGYHLSLETNGSQKISSIHNRTNLMISLDMKCPSSQMHTRMDLTNLHALTKQDQLKFIIATKDDYCFAKDIIQKNNVLCTIFFQPVWGTNTTELTDWILKDNLPVRLGLQLHKIIWGERQGI